MNIEELYERHQVLCALSGVLLHDLRNPLHSATLLIEAMGLRSSDADGLRARLRAQLAKLEALISDAAGPMRELTLEPRVAPVPLRAIVSDVVALVRAHDDGLENRLAVGAPPDVEVRVDRRLIARAVLEIVLRTAEEMSRVSPSGHEPVLFQYSADATAVQVQLAGIAQPFPEAFAKAPFTIGGGGIGTALARSLAQISGATLKLQGGSTPQPAFVFGLPRAVEVSP